MADAASSPLAQLIRRALDDPRVRSCSDQELLRRFLAEQDEAAFEALLRRHGPMVLDVCRGVLANEADAEDAFQATFLVLARKAASIRKAASLASWLHGVAYRVARKAQAESARRDKHEGRASQDRPVAAAADDLTWREVRQVVHEELSRLSERYRAPLVLCYLEGKTQDEAAATTGPAEGHPEGLPGARPGAAPGAPRAAGVRAAAALLVAAGRRRRHAAGVPAALVSSTVKAAATVAARGVVTAAVSANVAALTEGVLKAMFLTKLKAVAAAFVAVGVLAAGLLSLPFAGPGGNEARASDPRSGAAGEGSRRTSETGSKPGGGQADKAGDEMREGDLARLQGTWTGEMRSVDVEYAVRLTIEGSDFTEVLRQKPDGPEVTTRGQIVLDESADPKQMTMKVSSTSSSRGQVRVPGRIPNEVKAIYKLDGKGLTRRTGRTDRPTEFKPGDPGQIVFTRQ